MFGAIHYGPMPPANLFPVQSILAYGFEFEVVEYDVGV